MMFFKKVSIPEIIVSVFLWAVMVSGQEKDTILLESIPKVGPPEISKSTVKITVNFIFNHFTSDYWLYYNKLEKRLVFEFIGVHLDDGHLEITGTDILSGLEVQNSTSEFAVNKKISRLSMLLDEGWHYESWTIGSKIIRLQIYTSLDPAKNLRKEKKMPFPLIIISILIVASGTFLLSVWIHDISK